MMNEINNSNPDPVTRFDAASLASAVISSALSGPAAPDIVSAGIGPLAQELMAAFLGVAPAEEAPMLIPAVDPEKSVFPDHIICLEDGKPLLMLARHLRQKYGMTPEEYRARWGLPASYPMTAPNYTKRRSEIAIAAGLGKNKAPAGNKK